MVQNSWLLVQALDVTAEPGSVPPTRVESHPLGASSSDLLIPWYAILLLCLGVLAGLALAARIWHRRTRRLVNAVLQRWWPSRASRSEEHARLSEAGAAPAESSEAGELSDGAGLSGAGLTSRAGNRSAKALAEQDPMFAGHEYSDGATRR